MSRALKSRDRKGAGFPSSEPSYSKIHVPRIEDRRTRMIKLASISGDDCHLMMNRGGSDDEIRLGERVPGLTPSFNQMPPPQHDIFGDLQDSTFKHWSHD